MKDHIVLERLLTSVTAGAQRRASFALLCLGVTESLASGAIGASDAVRLFFNADNCLYVRSQVRGAVADRLMGHGAQLPDLFDALPADEALREFQRELATMRSLCLKLLEGKQIAA